MPQVTKAAKSSNTDLTSEAEDVELVPNNPNKNPNISLSRLLQGLQRQTSLEAARVWKEEQRSDNSDPSVTSDSDDCEEAGWEYLKHNTISDDQTAESDFDQRKLSAVRNREALPKKGEFTNVGEPSSHAGPSKTKGFTKHSTTKTSSLKLDLLPAWARQILDVLDAYYPIPSSTGFVSRSRSPNPTPTDDQSRDPTYWTVEQPDLSRLSISEGIKKVTLVATMAEPLGTLVDDSHLDQLDKNTIKQIVARNKELEAEIRRLKGVHDEDGVFAKLNTKGPTWATLHGLDGSVSLHEPHWAVQDGQKRVLRMESPLANESRYLESHPEIAFVVYKTYDRKDETKINEDLATNDNELAAPKAREESIRLTTDDMQKAMKTFLDEVADFDKQFPSFKLTERIPAPYPFWYYCRSSSMRTLERLHPEQKHLMRLLSGWLESNYGQHYTDCDTRLAEGFASESSIQYLVKAGDVLVSYDEDGHLRGYESTSWIEKIPELINFKDFAEENDESQSFKYRIQASSWELGDEIYRQAQTLTLHLDITDTNGEIAIAKLSVFPLRYARERDQEVLKRRGQTYWRCRERRLVEYAEGDWLSAENNFERYMIDYETYKKLHKSGGLRHQPRRSEDRYVKLTDEKSGPQGNETYLFPPTIKGFNLRRKKWLDLDVDKVHEVQWNKTAFDNLVVNKATKELIKALIMTRLQAENGADIIGGKGNGLIMLLHGGPGTGKTFTAETVAELAEKPLYRVTCGDIGTKPEEVENYLESVLQLGRIWQCVVLLDEADVFLEARTLNDLDRNALVSVFLRVLEYYDGILILTSNRVGTFDEAFKSRIQLALHYETLGEPQRSRIWSNFIRHFRSLGDQSIDFDDLEDHIGDLAKHDMNGRQIRNSITTARQLALYRRKELMDFQDLEHVLKISGKFDAYLRRLNEGLGDDEINRSNHVS